MHTLAFATGYVFNLVNQRTIYLSKQIDPALTEQMVDVIPLTEDENDFFKVELRNAAVEVFKAIASLSRGIETPYAIDTATIDSVDQEAVIYKINLKDETQSEIIIPVLTNNIQQALMHYVVLRWLKLKMLNNQPLFAIEQAEFERCIKEIRSMKGFGFKTEVPYRQF